MKKADRYRMVIETFGQKMPDAQTELRYDNPFQLLVAVILLPQ